MEISIIGAGNMGGAIARGLAFGNKHCISISNPSKGKLEAIKHDFPNVITTSDNSSIISCAEIIILAVKPWVVKSVIDEIKDKLIPGKQQIISVASGITTEALSEMINIEGIPLYHVIPNTAISLRQSMTFMSARNANSLQMENIKSLFDELGKTIVVSEEKMQVYTALASCGIAYALRYVRANVEGAVELGVRPGEATEIMANTLKGAAEILLKTGHHPEMEIDKVTTPGGLTIRGLNTLEENGFTNAVIKALKASL